MIRSIKIPKLAGKEKGEYAVLAVLLLIVANASLYAFTHIEGTSNYGDDANYLFLAGTVVRGNFAINPGYIFSVRLMAFFPIALAYLLFGISNFSSTIWNIVSYIGIILVAFLTVKHFYDEKAALISAYLVSVFPLLTQFVVNINEDVPLTLVISLAVLMFLRAEQSKNRRDYFMVGVLIVASWLISYEATIMILFLALYALSEILKGKIRLKPDRTIFSSGIAFMAYGIALSFLLVFLFSYFNSKMPFAVITTNLRFYSGIGQRVNGLPTIPTANTDLWFYPNAMFQYNVIYVLKHSGGMIGALGNLWNMFFNQTIAPVPYGLYFYLAVPILVLLLIFEKRSYFLASWLIFAWMLLEFGPMTVGLSLNPPTITYILAHRLERFMLIVAVPLSGIIGIGLSKLVSGKNIFLLASGAAVLLAVLALLYLSNYMISTFWYYWQYFPESLDLQAANYLRPYMLNSTIYVEAIYDDGAVTFTGANLQAYLGYPSDPLFDNVYKNVSCSYFKNNSYVVWDGNPGCGRLVNVLNITVPPYIPQAIIDAETPEQMYLPTNVYYAR